MYTDIQDGTYTATAVGAQCRESSNGNLMEVIRWRLNDTGMELTSYSVIVQADGTVKEKAVNELREIFGWDGIDPFWFVEHPEEVAVAQANLVIEHAPDRDDPTKSWPRIKWLNPIRHGNPDGWKEADDGIDKKSIRAKFGAKLRAVASLSKVQTPAPVRKPVAPAPAVAPAVKPPAPKPPVKQPPASDINAVWAFVCSQFPSIDEATKYWQTALKDVDVATADWSKIQADLAVDIAKRNATADNGNLPF